MKELPCEIVQDLLPSYVDELTSPVTNEAVQTHLETCPLCRESWQRMTEKPVLQMKSARDLAFRVIKTRRRRRLRLILCGVLAVLVLLALFVPRSTHRVRAYSGVCLADGREYPVTATLDLRYKEYLVFGDKYSGTLELVTKYEALQFELVSLTPMDMDLKPDSPCSLITFEYWIEGYGNGLLGGAADAELDRLMLQFPDDKLLILGTGDLTPEQVQEYITAFFHFS